MPEILSEGVGHLWGKGGLKKLRGWRSKSNGGSCLKNDKRRIPVLKNWRDEKKAELAKVKIALRLRKETTMTWEWTRQQLAMGVGGSAADAVRAAGSRK